MKPKPVIVHVADHPLSPDDYTPEQVAITASYASHVAHGSDMLIFLDEELFVHFYNRGTKLGATILSVPGYLSAVSLSRLLGDEA